MNRKVVLCALALGGLAVVTACGDEGARSGVGGVGGGAGGGVGGGAGGGAGGGDGGLDVDASVGCEGPPGLYQDDECSVLAEGVEFYQPRFVLWSDGADKQRYVYLPEGTTIDTTDPDGWVFPVGTRLYKTFSVDGKRIETRMLEKVEAGEGFTHWQYQSYAWNEAQNAVTAVPQGVHDALGTDHDIPSRSDCEQCHVPAARDMGLGFSAIQLNHDLTGIRLDALNGDGRLTTPIALADAEVPGDETARAALGYLHANCGHCHGGDSTYGMGGTSPALHMRLRVGVTGVENTDTYTTAVGVPSNWTEIAGPMRNRIEAGSPSDSAIHVRTGLRGADQMPPLGTEVVDDTGRAAVDAWIMSLAP